MNFFQKPNTKTVFLLPIATALVLRLVYHLIGIDDFWGDAYHNLFISSATLENGWVYTDFKGREVVWLPLFRYLVSLFIWIFQSQDILMGHLINVILGALSCGMIAKLTARASSNYTGLLSGLLLAVLPWHVAYSHMNMPEILGSFILILAVDLWTGRYNGWLILIGFLGALTKNEVTLYLGVLGVLGIYSREWKRILILGSGVFLGLLLWGFWNHYNTDSFFWWITERSVGSGWDKLFYSSQPTYFGDWYVPLLSILQVFPLALLVIFLPKNWHKIILRSENRLLMIVSVLVLFNWLFVIGMNLNYFPSPDARYFIITLPLACISFGLWMSKSEAFTKHGRKILLGVVFLNIIQWPGFYYLQYTLYPAVEIGKYLKQSETEDQNYWIDLPAAIYFAGIDRKNSFSSEMIIPKDQRDRKGFKHDIAVRLEERNIRRLVFQDVPYSYMATILPQLKESKSFRWRGITFEPLHQIRYETVQGGMGKQIEQYVVGGRSSSLWSLSY